VDNRYLIRQRQTWYAVVEVPPSLRKQLGRRVKRTLDTRDIHVARARRFRAVADIKALIEDARRGPQGDPIEQEALGWREAIAAAKRGEDTGTFPRDEDPVSFVRGLVGDRAEQLDERKATRGAVEGFLGIALETATPLRLRADAWLSEGSLRGGTLKERTKTERRKAVDKLGTWMQRDKLPFTVEAITRRVAGRYVSEVLIPSGRDPVTLGKSVRSLTSYWNWMQRRCHLPDEARNPWSGQAPSKSQRDGSGIEAERAFTDTELALLLTEPPDKTLADFILVGALTGMRREEIGRLTMTDCAGGVFVVREGKTEAAARRVPIHSGLTAVVARRSEGKGPDAFLFHELRSRNPERTDPIGKAFTRYRRSLNIQEGSGRRSRVNFHSMRRWFISAAINAGQPPHMVALLAGHREGRKGMTLGRYWQGADDAALRACVEAVKLPVSAP
jgi:integrase